MGGAVPLRAADLTVSGVEKSDFGAVFFSGGVPAPLDAMGGGVPAGCAVLCCAVGRGGVAAPPSLQVAVLQVAVLEGEALLLALPPLLVVEVDVGALKGFLG